MNSSPLVPAAQGKRDEGWGEALTAVSRLEVVVFASAAAETVAAGAGTGDGAALYNLTTRAAITLVSLGSLLRSCCGCFKRRFQEHSCCQSRRKADTASAAYAYAAPCLGLVSCNRRPRPKQRQKQACQGPET